MQTASSERQRTSVRPRIATIAGYLAGSLIILTFFFYFVVPGYRNRFAGDDMMNIDIYWTSGPWQLIKGLILFYSTYYRPMGGVFYMILYHFFGLTPLPYHIALDGILLLNIYLAYRLAMLLSGSRMIAGLTALFTGFHVHIYPWLTYQPSFIYDTLCFTFYFAALNYYVSIRLKGRELNWKQVTLFALLYVGALDAKEMAVSLPLLALVWEAIWYPPDWRSSIDLKRWMRGAALPALLTGAMTLVYIVGKTHGSGSLTVYDAYRPRFSLHQYAAATTHFLSEYFFVEPPNSLNELQCLGIFATLFYLAWRLREKHLWFAGFFVLIAPLPITFIPGRGGGCLYIPLFGWAIAVSTIFLAIAAVLKREPPLRRLPLPALRVVLALIAVVAFWRITYRHDAWLRAPFGRMNSLTWSALQQLRMVLPSVKPHTRIAYRNDPFEGKYWDMKFITELNYNDHTITVWLTREVALPETEIQKFDIILDWQNGKLILLKPPPSTRPG